jgi:hypothetical protein
VLTEEHSQLLSRQVGVTGQRTSLRQQLLTLEEQHTQARAQVGVGVQGVCTGCFRGQGEYELTWPAAAAADTGRAAHVGAHTGGCGCVSRVCAQVGSGDSRSMN